jgi:ketosteroid isomerase-like protein
MSQRNVEAVRRPLQVRKRSSRGLDERLALRFPRLTAAYLRRIGKLSPRSRLRQATYVRGTVLGMEAYNRRDLRAVVIGWHPRFEYRPGSEWVKAGLAEPSYRGLTGYRQYVEATAEVWGRENTLRPVELIDLGERIVILADGEMRAQASGIPLANAFALVATLEDGRLVRLQEYYDHAEALEAAGLRE